MGCVAPPKAMAVTGPPAPPHPDVNPANAASHASARPRPKMPSHRIHELQETGEGGGFAHFQPFGSNPSSRALRSLAPHADRFFLGTVYALAFPATFACGIPERAQEMFDSCVFPKFLFATMKGRA